MAAVRTDDGLTCCLVLVAAWCVESGFNAATNGLDGFTHNRSVKALGTLVEGLWRQVVGGAFHHAWRHPIMSESSMKLGAPDEGQFNELGFTHLLYWAEKEKPKKKPVNC